MASNELPKNSRRTGSKSEVTPNLLRDETLSSLGTHMGDVTKTDNNNNTNVFARKFMAPEVKALKNTEGSEKQRKAQAKILGGIPYIGEEVKQTYEQSLVSPAVDERKAAQKRLKEKRDKLDDLL